MAYTINKTDGTVIATITDGTINNSTSLTLFGKSYSGFGEALNEDLVKLLENSAGTSTPTAPIKGELWFDTTANQLKVYDGTAFKPAGGSKSQATATTSASAVGTTSRFIARSIWGAGVEGCRADSTRRFLGRVD